MTAARLFLANCLIWLLTLASPAAATDLTFADLQHRIGDQVVASDFTEGSLAHAVLHGAVGCVAAEALDGHCASGAAAAVAMSLYSGTLDGTAPDESDTEAYNAWRAQVADQAQLIDAGVGYVTSGGLAANVSNGASIAQSGAVNNYLSHTQLDEYQRAWGACNDDVACIRAVVEEFAEVSLAQQHALAMCGNDLACIAPHLQAMAAARDHPLWQSTVDALWGPYGTALGELEYQAHQVYLNYQHDVGNPFPLNLFSGWMVREHDAAYGSYAGWAQDNCSGMSGAACMADFQKIRTVSAHWEGYKAGSEAFLTSATIGLGGGLTIAVAPSAVATMRLCAANPLCWAEVAGLGGEIGLGATGATAGQTFFSVAGQTSAVVGSVILQHGDEIIRVIDDLGRVLTPVSQSVDDAGRFLMRSADGATGYLDDANRFVPNAPNTGPRVTIRDHYEHHDAMRNDVIGQLEGQGYRVADGEASFGNACGSGRCRPDILYEAPDGTVGIIEIKTGSADLSIRQTEIFPQIENGDAIPRGAVADRFGLEPGVPLREQGYPSGIPIEVREFPGAGQ